MTVKNLQELNIEFQEEWKMQRKSLIADKITESVTKEIEKKQTPIPLFAKKSRKTKKKHGVIAIISDWLFYAAIVAVVLTILTNSSKTGAPRTIMGYSYFTVLTSSMQNEIPRGSFILTKETNPMDIKIGDTITYMRDATSTVTHKVIDIIENYEESGQRGFGTKGVNNSNPDPDIVYAKNVVGVVQFHIPAAGIFMTYLRENIYVVFIMFGLCVLLSFTLRGLFVKKPRPQAV